MIRGSDDDPHRLDRGLPTLHAHLHSREMVMKRALLILVVAVLGMGSIHSASATQSSILEKRNEYGGRTEAETYTPDDGKFKEGLLKLVLHYDGNDRIIKLESFFNDNHATIDGVQRSVQYFDNKFYRTGIRTRVEFTFTDSYAAREGLARAIEYYDEAEKRTKIEYFYTDAYAKKRQVSRLEVLYDPKGTIVTRTYTDKDGKVLLSETKK
jgi:hypothetical protein